MKNTLLECEKQNRKRYWNEVLPYAKQGVLTIFYEWLSNRNQKEVRSING